MYTSELEIINTKISVQIVMSSTALKFKLGCCYIPLQQITNTVLKKSQKKKNQAKYNL